MPPVVLETDDAASSVRLLTLQADCTRSEAVAELRGRMESARRDGRRRLVLCGQGHALGGGAAAALIAARPQFEAVLLCELEGRTRQRLRQVDPRGTLEVFATRQEALLAARVAAPPSAIDGLRALAEAVHALQGGKEPRMRTAAVLDTAALRAIRDLLVPRG